MPGIDADAVRAGLESELARFGERGVDASMTLLTFDESTGSTESTIVAALTERPWDVVVVGGGIRKPDALVALFEQVVNLVRRHAPQAAIAFNTSGGDSVEAAGRWL